MAAKPQISTKRVAISKANAQMVGIVAGAAFITIFCLVASKAVFSQERYQARVISAKEKANDQLEANLKNFSSLQKSYAIFNSAPTNIIGGSATGTGDNDGTNSKIILDALPSSYDFPALTSSLEKILADNNLKVSSITGTDDQVNQQNNLINPNPQAVSMSFSFTVNDANYSSVSQLITKLQESIRPVVIDTLDLSGAANNMTATVNAHTYFQPVKGVSITKKVIK
jgi:hypothetical protein